jgi:hypothetical protein
MRHLKWQGIADAVRMMALPTVDEREKCTPSHEAHRKVEIVNPQGARDWQSCRLQGVLLTFSRQEKIL